ncbi:MAG: hypothetical protein WCG48_00015 [Candidatus Berkelbacteria bacterium]
MVLGIVVWPIAILLNLLVRGLFFVLTLIFGPDDAACLCLFGPFPRFRVVRTKDDFDLSIQESWFTPWIEEKQNKRAEYERQREEKDNKDEDEQQK